PSSSSLSYSTIPPPPRPTLFPYTTLFRSGKIYRPGEIDSASQAAPSRLVRLRTIYAQQGGKEVAWDSYRRLKNRLPPLNGLHIQIGRAPSELQSPCNLVCRLLLEKKKKNK